MAFGFLQGRHARLREQLSAYIDDELSPPERFEVEHHLETCVECREELDDLQTIARATGMLPEVPAARSFTLGPGLAAERVSATRPIESAPPADGRRIPWFLLGWAAAGVAALALGAGVAHMLTSIGNSGSQAAQSPSTNAAVAPPTTPPPTALATVPAIASATAAATATSTATPAATPPPVVAGVPSGPSTSAGSAGGGGSAAAAAAAGAAPAPPPVGTAGQPGGAAVVTIPNRPGSAPAAAAPVAPAPTPAPAAAAPVATAPGAVVAAPPTRTSPGQATGSAITSQPAPSAAVTRPSAAPVTGVAPQVIGAGNGGVLIPPAAAAAPAGAPVPVRAAPISPTAGR